MGALHKQFKTDPAIEKGGITLDYGPNDDLPKGEDGEHPTIQFKVARAGGANNEFVKALERSTKPYKKAIQTGTLSNEIAKKLDRDAFLDTCLLGWSNVTDKDGNLLEFSRQAADKLFTELPELYADVREMANNMALYREEVREADLGNSGRSLSTASSKDL